jgi:hypothetical protein
MADKIYKGDIGTLFIVDTQSDLSGATTSLIKIRKPDGTEADWSASVSGQTLRYTVVSGDLDQAGNYLGHAYVVLPSGTWRGERFTFIAYDEWK